MAENEDPFGVAEQGPGSPDSTANPVGDAFSWIRGFVRSGVESIPEMVGITPSTETLQYRQDNPVGGFVSELAGMAVPYTGWLKATQKIGRFNKAVEGIGDVVNKPFVTGALQNAARFAPFEAARLGVSQVVGDKPFSDMLGDTTLNLALGSGVAGLFHGLAAAGVRDPALTTLFPGIDLAAPLPLQARQMRDIINSGTLQGDTLGRANAKLAETLRAARTEELPQSMKYVGTIAHDQVPGSDVAGLQQQLNRLFKTRDMTSERTLQVRKFAQGSERDFPDQATWQDMAKNADLPPGFEEHGQYFRHVSFKNEPQASGAEIANTDRVAQNIDNKLTRNMIKVGDFDFMTKEADDGMFVMARKVNGEVGTGDATDQWVLFKTDKPGAFLPEADKWAKGQVAIGKWTPGADLAANGGVVYDAIKNFTQQFPLRNYMAMGRNPSGVAKAISAIMPTDIVGPQKEVVARLGEAIKEYLAPRIYQFKKSWRANWIVNSAKVAYDQAENTVQELVNGKVKVDPGKNLFFQGLKDDKSPSFGFDPIRQMVMAVPEDKFQSEFASKIWRERIGAAELPQRAQTGEFSPEIVDLATKLDKIDQFNHNNISRTEVAVGKTPLPWQPGYYGLGRRWEGDTRVVLKDESGDVVALAGGVNRRAAQKSAEQLIKENPNWLIDGEYSLSQGVIPKQLEPVVKSPSFTLEPQDIRGFKFDTQPFTREEFVKEIENAFRSKYKYQANLSTNDILGPQMSQLQREDPAAFRMAQARLFDYAGVPSAFSRLQNKYADQVLGPLIGPNSASKIVQVTNTSLFNLQLGALKLAYPVVNALQFVQTVTPEIAFIMGKAPEEALAGRYSFFAAGGTKGPAGGMAVLSPIKLMYQSMREMAKPTPELSSAFERAVNDRVIDPRLVEDYIGAASVKAQNVREAFKSGGNFVEWLRALSEYMPAQTERLSRTHAFTTGYMIGRDFLKRGGQSLDPDQLYNFARQFTENTMYLYSSADKPRIFTTPAGSLLGLFKNWMFHYMASMGEFTHEAFVHNNWSPLLWQTTGTFALGGLSATPLYWAADGFSRMWSKKGVMENAYEQFDKGGDGIMYGLPAATTGISLYSQVDSPLSNPVRDASSLFSIAAWDRVKQMQKTVGQAIDHWQATGEHAGHDPGVRELLIRTFAPTTIYRTMGAMEPGQITQLGTDYPVVKNVPPVHRALYALGFNPVELDRGQAISEELHEKHTKMQGQVKKLGEAWAQAEQSHDSVQLATIMRQAIVWGVDVSQVIKGGMKVLDNQRKDVVERGLRPKDYAPYAGSLAVQRGLNDAE